MSDYSHQTTPPESFDEALARILRGSGVAESRAVIQPPSDNIEPMLLIAVMLRQEAATPLPPDLERWLPHGARDFTAIANQMLKRPSLARRLLTPLRRPVIQRTIAGVVLSAILLASVDTASARSLPGEPLYTWKVTHEDLSLSIEFNPAQRGRLHVDYARRRLTEIDRLLANGAAPDSALLTATVSDLATHVRGAIVDSQIGGAPDSAATIDALLSDVQVTLSSLASKAPATQPAVNQTQQQIYQALQLSEPPPVTNSESTATPTLSPTITPAPTAPLILADSTSAATVEPAPTNPPPPTARPPRATPTATTTSSPTTQAHSLSPTATPSPTTAIISATPQPSSTPRPSATPQPSSTPRPSATPQPSSTPPPTATRIPATVPALEVATPEPPPTARPARPTVTPTDAPPSPTPSPTSVTPTATPTSAPSATATSAPPTATATSIPPTATLTPTSEPPTPTPTDVTVSVANDSTPSPTPVEPTPTPSVTP